VLQCGAVGGEVVEGGDAAVAFVGAGVSPGAEAGTDYCGFGGKRRDYSESFGGGDSVSTEGGDVAAERVLVA